jgi:pyruvate/2-oxoglutarate dehydrogenase complex dihydrolipoamide acyltransferase (E2) component
MRFLLFNIVVAGALVFLFTSDKADLHAAADRAHDAANDIKSKAFEVIGAQQTAKPQPTIKQAPVTEPAQPAQPAEKAHAETATAETEDTFSQNKPLAPAAAKAVREVQVATRKLVEPQASKRQTVKPLQPEVEQRREEILAEGIVGEPATEAQKYMPASTRKRDLMLLSEEMELFSAEAISR